MIHKAPTIFCASEHNYTKQIHGFESVIVVRSFRKPSVKFTTNADNVDELDDVLVTGFQDIWQQGEMVDSLLADTCYAHKGEWKTVQSSNIQRAFSEATHEVFFVGSDTKLAETRLELEVYTKAKRMAALSKRMRGDAKPVPSRPKVLDLLDFFNPTDKRTYYEFDDAQNIPFSTIIHWPIYDGGYGSHCIVYSKNVSEFILQLKSIAEAYDHIFLEVKQSDIPMS